MARPHTSRDRAPASLDQTLDKTEAVAADVQRASDNLAVINTVLEQELPDDIQVGEVAQAIEHAGQLEKKLAQSAETLAEVNAALTQEIERRVEVTAERDENQAMIDKLNTKARSSRGASTEG
ncbi:hypothetical protein [Variovorax sp. PBL-E5]|uniref:hypothetical protein n=1 Tax=Variovorax sp. PBL-E5 TaxID=434014 RepID=UPI0013164EBD|nr:hypothetical protein [Variovorax sp. PBL-E5]VTU28384.1 hypothetical protein E5CHR_02598 [Variovorax sp. PBL-E5]